jgi:CRP-like cAMP-binding protein
MMERALTTCLPVRMLSIGTVGSNPCTTICDVRAVTVRNAIADADLTRLATIAVVIEVPTGQCFVDVGEPTNCFFVVTAGTATLFKLLPDRRRQIIRFVGPGQFFGLAVSDIYAFSAQAIEPVRYCRFQRANLRALMDDFPLNVLAGHWLSRDTFSYCCCSIAWDHVGIHASGDYGRLNQHIRQALVHRTVDAMVSRSTKTHATKIKITPMIDTRSGTSPNASVAPAVASTSRT